MVLLSMGGVAVVEQPGTSILAEHVAFKSLVALLRVRKIPAARLCLGELASRGSNMFSIEVFKQPFWMRQFGHQCLKRTLLWSVSPAIRRFAQWRIQQALLPPRKKAFESYVDGNGQKRFKGGEAMKQSQLLE